MKRFGSTIYYQYRRGSWRGVPESNPDGYLYAQGRYPTKIKPEDLPEWYFTGMLRGQNVYISAKGVKYLVFIPTYNNHLNKDDLLYISYDTPIVPDTRSPSGKWLHGYAHILYGGIVSDYLKAVAKYSRYDVKPIQKQIEEKSKWYHSNYEF